MGFLSREAANAAAAGGLQRQVERGLLLLAATALLALALRPSGLSGPAALSLPLIVLIVILVGWIERTLPPRPLHIGSLFLLIAAVQPASLVVAEVLEGEVLYETRLGLHTHSEHSVRLAGATAVFLLAYTISFLLVPFRKRGGVATWEEASAGIDEALAVVLAFVGVACALVRVELLVGEEAPDTLKYFLRLFVGYFAPLVFFVGVGLRRGLRWSSVAALVSSGCYFVIFVSGSRGDAILPMAYMVLGVTLAKKLDKWVMVWALPAMVATGMLVMGIGEALRSDNLGRTASAAEARFEASRGAGVYVGSPEILIEGSVRRLLRNGSHAVLAGVPERLDFEENGLWNLPSDFLSGFLPRFNWTGIDPEREPRNAILNSLGFLVTWDTSVELAAMPDGWLRGGWLGVVLVGALLGAFSRSVQEFTYRMIDADATYVPVLLVLSFNVGLLEGKDLTWGIRATILAVAAASLMAECIRLARRAGPGFGGRRGRAVGHVPSRVRDAPGAR